MGRKNNPRGAKKAESFKRELRREIMNLMATQPHEPMNHKQIAGSLSIKDAGMRVLIYELLLEAVSKGEMKQISRGKFKLIKQKNEVIEGKIEITQTGRGFVILEGYEEDIPVRKVDTGGAFWGDMVEIAISRHKGKLTGRVLKVTHRAREQYVGILELSTNHAFVVATDRRIHTDFFIPRKKLNGAMDGDKVVVKMTDWKNPDDSPFGEIIAVLGKPGENDTEMHSIMAEYELPYEFPAEVELAAEQIPTEITKEEIAKRRDMRKTVTFTIDPDNAKDFDDALSLKKLENGNWEVGVHIADVSHYLTPGSILDDEAINRATSVYLVDRVVPMLPEVLSNGLCSLRPNEEKLCFSAVFELDDNANMVGEWFGRTVILSDRRFTYEDAQEMIEGAEGDFKDEILTLDRLSKLLRAERFKEGSLDFSTEEVKFNLDENGKPLGVYTKVMKDANKLIEDFMLLANRRVARFIAKPEQGKAKTFVYRIHDLPNEQKLAELKNFVAHLGYELPTLEPGGNAKRELNKLLARVEGKAEAESVKQLAIRTMAKAEYSTDNIGHFGLSFDYYSHFTSPIRRYPDVMVHRLLALYLDGKPSAAPGEYQKLCKHASMLERKASEAERSSIKYKQVEFLVGRIGEQFEGTITGVTGWGMYVEINENKCEGMVGLKNISHDHFHFDQAELAVVGSRTGERYTLGDQVEIKVVGANLEKKQLDFDLVV
tara:strand:- start:20345 stop:22489 length:2145 start_codon:yes stop_codon:yes gene_type:complete